MSIDAPLVSVIILSWNGKDYLLSCLDSVLAQDYPALEVIVVDNHSTDAPIGKTLSQYSDIKLIVSSQNLGFAGGMNLGTRDATGEIIVWLNQDTIVSPDWLRYLIEVFSDPTVGVAGCKIFQPDGKTLHHAGGTIDLYTGETRHFGVGEPDVGQYDNEVNVGYVTGAAMAVRRSVLNEVGLLDERFFPGYYEDADYCVRVQQAGYNIRYVPRAVVLHHVSTSTNQWHRQRFYYYRNRLLFVLKHLSTEEFKHKFFPVELQKLEATSRSELPVIQIALSEMLMRKEGQSVSQSLYGLYEVVNRLRGTSPNLEPIREALNHTRSDLDGFIGVAIPVLREMETAWEVKEQPFRSNIPVIGRFVAIFREVWNSVAAKWYVLVLFKQQMRFNRLSNQILRVVTAYIWDNDTMLSLLEERCVHLEQRIVLLETKQGSGEK